MAINIKKIRKLNSVKIKTNMDTLPVVMLKDIFSFIGHNYVFSGIVCKEWNDIHETRKTDVCQLTSYSCIKEVVPYRYQRLNGFTLNRGMFSHAAKNGNIEVLKWLLDEGCDFEEHAFTMAAGTGNLEFMKWLLEVYKCLYPDKEDCEPFTTHTFEMAAENGNIEVMKWLRDKCNWDRFTIIRAAENGNLENMKWLVKEGCDFNDYEIFSNAAKNGNLENMKWLKTEGFLWDVDPYHTESSGVFANAAMNGNLENMKWLLQGGCPWGFETETFDCAVKNGNLENMKWLLREGCPWGSETFCHAALNGNLENMKWLLQEGCPWGPKTFGYAAKNGNLENMKWLLQEGCPWGSEDFYVEDDFIDMEVVRLKIQES